MKRLTLLMLAILCYAFTIAQEDTLRNIRLEEVSVLGTRAQENTPVTKVTVREAELEEIDLGQDAALHLERISPSIVTYSDAGTNFGNYQNFRLRGMDQTRINITLNGVPLNDMLDQGVFFSNFIDFSNSMESIQVQRGVGTSTNGTSSYAGSINYESKSLYDEKPEAGLRITGGSFGSLGLAAEANTGKTEKGLSAYGRMSRNVSSGYKDYSGSTANSFFFSGGYLGEKHIIKFTGFAGKTQNHQSYTPVPKSQIDRNPKTNLNHPNDVDDFEQEMAQLQYINFINNELSFTSTVYYSGARGYFPFTFFGAQYNYGIRNDQYGAMSSLSWNKDSWKVNGGIHAYIFNRENETSVSPDLEFPYYKDESEKDEISAFIKAEKNLKGTGLTLFGDVQVRSVNLAFISDSLEFYNNSERAERSFLFLNPKIGATYSLNERNSVYLAAGITEREPTRTDIFGGADAVYGFNYQNIISEDSMQSETVNDLELGYNYRSAKIRLQLNAFYMDFQNEISVVGGLANNSYVFIRQNVASSQRYGLEMNLDMEPIDNLKFRLMATYLETNVNEFDNGLETLKNVKHAFAPNLNIRPEVSYTLFDKLTIGFGSRFLSESFMELSNDPDFIIPESMIFNSWLTYQFNDNIDMGIWLNNITDEVYFTDGAPVNSLSGNTGAIPIPEPGYRIQAPRNIFGKVNFRF